MKKFAFTFIFIVTFFTGSISYSQVMQEWAQIYSGPGNDIDLTFSIALDNLNNVYVSGYSIGATSGRDIVTIKYNSSGVQQWLQRYNGPANGDDISSGLDALAVDDSGNVYVVGYSMGIGGNSDFVTLKYNTNGVQQWAETYNGAADANDFGRAISLDASGNVYVTGSSIESGTSTDYATIKYNNNGVQQWVSTYNGTGNSYDFVYAIAVDDGGNSYVTGSANGTGSSDDCVTIKYNTDGVQQWAETYNGSANGGDTGYSICLDSSGNVFVTGGSAGSGTSSDYLTIKYNSAGVQQWASTYNSGGSSYDYANCIDVDNSGNAYVTGTFAYSEGGTSDNYGTIKYNSTGDEQWVRIYDGPEGILDNANSITVDENGNSYIIGSIDGGSASFNQNLALVKYNTDGVQQWVQIYNGVANSNDAGLDVVLDTDGNIYVAGGCTGVGTSMDYLVIKYSETVPVELTSFNANVNGNIVELKWITATETNNKGFEIERKSADGIYKQISFISGNGTTTQPQVYSFTDENVSAGNYIYRLKQVDFDGSYSYSNEVEVKFEIPSEFSLSQNYPNPFNPTTTIRYQIPHKEFVTLKTYDILGNEVAALVNEEKPAGSYTVEFTSHSRDEKALSSGLYFYTISAGSFISTKKMLLLK